MFCARAEGELNVLSQLDIHTSDREVVGLSTRRLPYELYHLEQRTNLLRPGITCSEMEKIVRTSYANRKTKALEERKFAVVASAAAAQLANPQALSVGGGCQGNS